MNKHFLHSIITLIFLSGCTQVVTVPIAVAGATVGAVIDVTGSAVGAITSSDNEEKN